MYYMVFNFFLTRSVLIPSALKPIFSIANNRGFGNFVFRRSYNYYSVERSDRAYRNSERPEK